MADLRFAGWLLGVALATSACGDTSVEAGAVLPNFSLEDVNDTSPTAGQSVSPRDYAGQISAWYFAHAT